MQESALGAAVATTGRLAEFAVREAGVAATTLREVLSASPGSWAPGSGYHCLFGELDRIPGPRSGPSPGLSRGTSCPADWRERAMTNAGCSPASLPPEYRYSPAVHAI